MKAQAIRHSLDCQSKATEGSTYQQLFVVPADAVCFGKQSNQLTVVRTKKSLVSDKFAHDMQISLEHFETKILEEKYPKLQKLIDKKLTFSPVKHHSDFYILYPNEQKKRHKFHFLTIWANRSIVKSGLNGTLKNPLYIKRYKIYQYIAKDLQVNIEDRKGLKQILIQYEEDKGAASSASYCKDKNHILLYEDIELKPWKHEPKIIEQFNKIENQRKNPKEFSKIIHHELCHWLSEINGQSSNRIIKWFKQGLNKLSFYLFKIELFKNKASQKSEFINALKLDYETCNQEVESLLSEYTPFGSKYGYYLPSKNNLNNSKNYKKTLEECFVEICCTAMEGQGNIESEKIKKWFPNTIQWVQNNILKQYQ